MDVPDEEEVMNNPNIMSKTISVGEKSFVDNRQPYNKLAPPPRYYTEEEILEKFKLPQSKDEILYGMEFPECGGLVCTDQEMLNK